MSEFKKRRNFRARRHNSSDDDDDISDLSDKVELHKELRKMREKQHGISAISLASGTKITKEEEHVLDPFKTSGGMVDMELLKNSVAKDDAYDIGTQFSKETNTRDEEAEMIKYIDNELNKRKTDQKVELNQHKFLSPEEAAIASLPEHLRSSTAHKSEEMLSFQMLNGIPEVDLGIEVKIKNIEETENAKQKILQERMKQKELSSQFHVPCNMAVNFVQHNRFNIDEPSNKMKRKVVIEPEVKKKVVVVGAEPEEHNTTGNKEKEKGTDKATDDFHFEKFKKQFRRY